MNSQDGQDSKEKRLTLLRSLGPSFCLAKWLQVTLDLEHGTTHSCHHPKRHLIPLESLEQNPSLLHNTPLKKRLRGYMMEGLRPKECFYCWDLEDASKDGLSDRLIKSSDDWAFERLSEVRNNPQEDLAPAYLEVMFSSLCNLCCAYCMSDISSQVQTEMNKFGPYPVRQKDHREKEFPAVQGENPYIKAFWKWFPQIAPSLKYLRITGGEPFLASHLKSLMDFLQKTPNPNLTFAINSNCSLPYKELEPSIVALKKLLTEKKVKALELYASIDTFGPQAEYARLGLRYDLFFENLHKIKNEIPELKIVFMTTFSIFSLESFAKLLKDVIVFKKQFKEVSIDIAPLKNPEYLRPEIAASFFQDNIEESQKLMSDSGLFSSHEQEKFSNLKLLMKQSKENPQLSMWKRDFINFVQEYDKRHNISFETTFVKLSNFLKENL